MQGSCSTQHVPTQSLLSHYETWQKRMQDLSGPRTYQEVINTTTSEKALRPFNPELKTIHVVDAGTEGIASSVFQEQDNG